ncbi:MAG: class I SAM-dependent methyltransferase [Mesorhizobium sp.]|nr:class I SAM-dependent methyltransferase [Mesorhizobium sp.]MBN9242095.1 class I SAM-dependent methyltransferase [Mesorhizobium sp.]
MAQNIYDRPDFFAGYATLERSRRGLDGAPEWPVLRSMLPDLAGKRVLDLGCGYGWFCRWAAEQAAASVVGIDISEKMLAKARVETASAIISFRRADLETLELADGGFDLVYSSLAFHYLPDTEPLYRTINRALRAGGSLVFSVEHPAFTASARAGWITADDGLRFWRLDSYQREGERRTDWFAKGVVKYHRTLATTLNQLIGAGFAVRRIEEFCPSAEQIAADPSLGEEVERPTFLLIAADA